MIRNIFVVADYNGHKKDTIYKNCEWGDDWANEQLGVGNWRIATKAEVDFVPTPTKAEQIADKEQKNNALWLVVDDKCQKIMNIKIMDKPVGAKQIASYKKVYNQAKADWLIIKKLKEDNK